MAIGKGTGKKQRCRKANVFPCKTRCVPRYNSRSGKEQRCRNVAEGAPSTYLQWIKSQDERKGKINAKRQKQGQTLFESDSAGYLVNPDKNKGKLPASYRQKAKEARKIGAESQDPKIKALAEETAKKAEAVAEKAEQLTAPAQDELSQRRAAKDKKPSTPAKDKTDADNVVPFGKKDEHSTPKPAPEESAKLPESPTARLKVLQTALNQTNALLKKAPTPGLQSAKKTFEKQIAALHKQIREGIPKPKLNEAKPAPEKSKPNPMDLSEVNKRLGEQADQELDCLFN